MSEPYWVPLGAAPAPPAVPGIDKLYDRTLAGVESSFAISGIPQTYAHLRLVGMLRGDVVATLTDLRLQFNGDVAANYDSQMLQGAAASPGADELLAGTFFKLTNGLVAASAPAGRGTPLDFSIPCYASALFGKAVGGTVGLPYGTGTTAIHSRAWQGYWRTVAALTSILIFPASGNFVAGSRLTLYGLI